MIDITQSVQDIRDFTLGYKDDPALGSHLVKVVKIHLADNISLVVQFRKGSEKMPENWGFRNEKTGDVISQCVLNPEIHESVMRYLFWKIEQGEI